MAEYVNPDTLVDTDWVAAHGGDDDVRLVEVDVDTSSYDSGHIPGAVGWNWETQLSDGIRRDIASPEQWKELLESLRHRRRHPRHSLRRQQQLVRGLCLLAVQDGRP